MGSDVYTVALQAYTGPLSLNVIPHLIGFGAGAGDRAGFPQALRQYSANRILATRAVAVALLESCSRVFQPLPWASTEHCNSTAATGEVSGEPIALFCCIRESEASITFNYRGMLQYLTIARASWRFQHLTPPQASSWLKPPTRSQISSPQHKLLEKFPLCLIFRGERE